MINAEVLEMLQRYLKWIVIPIALCSAYKLCFFLLPGPHHHGILTYKDKTVLITGASSGLGRALAFELYKRGAKIIATARSIDKLKELCEDMKRSFDGNPHEPAYSYLDVCEPMDVELLKNHAIDGKTIHVLINNAGLSMRGSIVDTPIDIYKQLMDVNFFGHIVVTQKLMDAIPDDGCIIATSSVQGKLPIPYRSAYGASKHAFQAFFDALRCEARPNLHILTVSAGYMNTGFGSRALNVEGHPVGKNDLNQLKGLSPECAACEILRAASAREIELIMAPFSNKIAIFLRWAWPTLLFYILHRRGLKDEYAKSRTIVVYILLFVLVSTVLLFQVCNYRGYIKLSRSKFEEELDSLRRSLEDNLGRRRSVVPSQYEVNDFLRSNVWLLSGFAAGWLIGFGLA
ncbi:unnamed protein product [Angiostrongylus costaricensis]|uniref:Short-chain dehydrogenase/reductase family protein n=1 Tax=Angiostrongylus costaricensis TaxID=334426 RepID=A0A158PH55_ANGCS|nr:unnamed protein product [Angiostrongylus costaricensis]